MLAVVAFGAAKADAYVYWGDFQNGRIGRAANDGTEVNDSFVAEAGKGPDAVAVDAGHVYWADQTGESIGRANIDGSGVEDNFITGVGEATGLAVTGSSIYWSANEGSVGRAAINGTGKSVDFISAPALPCGVAVDSGHVYWADIDNFGAPSYIGRAGLDGNNVEDHFVTIPGTSFPCGVAVNAANIYWTEPGFLGRRHPDRAGQHQRRRHRRSQFHRRRQRAVWDRRLRPAALLGELGKQRDRQGEHRCDRAQSILHPNRGQSDLRGRRRCPAARRRHSPSRQEALRTRVGGGAATDVTPPETRIATGPGKKLAQGKARFSFRSNEDGSTFTCKFDGKKPVGCTSPKRYSGLTPGKHVLKVWATDRAGNKDPTPAKRRFTVPAPA